MTIAVDADITVRNENTGRAIGVQPLAPIVRGIVMAGGLVPYFREHGEFLV